MKIRSLDLKKENRQIAHTRFDYLLLLQSISHPPINRGTNFEIQTKKKMRHNVHILQNKYNTQDFHCNHIISKHPVQGLHFFGNIHYF